MTTTMTTTTTAMFIRRNKSAGDDVADAWCSTGHLLFVRLEQWDNNNTNNNELL